ncbi:MAG: DUF192 domain-containing protein [Rubrobacter sp.]|nr:DUF192 domain-containing protein [Rubrobacter sp.]
MRVSLALLTFLFVSLLFVAGCGGEQGSAPEKEETLPAPPETTEETATASTSEESPTLAIISSSGARIEVEVEIADERAEQQRGLMERTALAEDGGMLFVFERNEPRSFWMRNTLIPLSIAYIADGGRIVDIQDMQPLDETSHPSAEPARYALEVNQGFFAERGIGVGDEVEVPGS